MSLQATEARLVSSGNSDEEGEKGERYREGIERKERERGKEGGGKE